MDPYVAGPGFWSFVSERRAEALRVHPEYARLCDAVAAGVEIVVPAVDARFPSVDVLFQDLPTQLRVRGRPDLAASVEACATAMRVDVLADDLWGALPPTAPRERRFLGRQ